MSGQPSRHLTTKLPKDLTILWANVGKKPASHNAALSLAEEQKIDVVCIQEPWVGSGTTTQNNPAYHLYAPIESWSWENSE